MFPEEDRHNLERTKEALKSRFKSTEIEELRGMEFHHKMQTTESVEELGLELQTLANKAFPSTPAKDFDRMLKGRFFQALLVRWQRKLGAPKPTESFKELYDRARIMEQHEKQYAAAAAARGETKHLHQGGRYKPSNNSTGDYPKNVGTTEEDKENHGKNTGSVTLVSRQDIFHDTVHSKGDIRKLLDVISSLLLVTKGLLD